MQKLYDWIDAVWHWISAKIFVRFEFSLPVEEVKRIHREGRLLFALTHCGWIEWLILSSWCRTQGMGAILVANRKRILLFSKPLYFLQVLFRRKSYADLFLLNREKGPRLLVCPSGERKRAFVPTAVEQLLTELYSQTDVPLNDWKCVPVVIFWRKHSRGESRQLVEYLFGLSSNPNLLGQLWYLLRKRRDSVVKALPFIPIAIEGADAEAGEPIDIDATAAQRSAKTFRRKILVAVNQEMRIVLGPRYYSAQSVKENLLRHPEIQALISQIAAEEGVDRKKVMMRAYQYLSEIVANYQMRMIEVLYVVLTWVFTKIFDGLEWRNNEVQSVRETMKTKPVVFVSAHRSHLDYLVIPYLLFVEDLVPPHIAAGVNLSFWPLGYFLRMGGAFFIRRSFRGNPLYSACLKKYVEYLLKNRHNIKFFIEGTRSRSGKMLPPAYGILKMVSEACQQGHVDDLALVPVSICYDEILEQASYTKELSGGQKEKENAKALLNTRKVIRKNIGKVYVRFAPALSVKAMHSEAMANSLDSKLELQKTAFQICKSINDVTPITPKAIVSTIFLSDRLASVTLEEVLRLSAQLAQYALQAGYPLSVPLEEEQFRRQIEQVVRSLQRNNILTMTEMVPRTFVCENRRRLVLAFYKNNAIHCYSVAGISLLALLRSLQEGYASDSAAAVYERYTLYALQLRNALKFDFFFSPTAEFLKDLQRNFQYFVGFQVGGDGTKQDVAKGLGSHFVDWDDLSVFTRCLGDLFESYLTAFQAAAELAGSQVDRKSFAARALKVGQGLQESGRLIFAESLSTQNYQSAFMLLENLKVLTAAADGTNWSVSDDLASIGDIQAVLRQYLQIMEVDPHELMTHLR